MKTSRKERAETRKALSLVGWDVGVGSRRVGELLDDLDTQAKVIETMRAALEEISADNWDLKHGACHWDRARDALASADRLMKGEE